jgi:hypothetical protein
LGKIDFAVRPKRSSNAIDFNNEYLFDFLNDEFLPVSKDGKLPDELYNIITDEEQKKNFNLYQPTPYAEVSSIGKKGKTGVNKSDIHYSYMNLLRTAGKEVFAQFLIRVYKEIEDCKIGEFSKLKTLNGTEFCNFRKIFKAEIKKCFVVPSYIHLTICRANSPKANFFASHQRFLCRICCAVFGRIELADCAGVINCSPASVGLAEIDVPGVREPRSSIRKR